MRVAAAFAFLAVALSAAPVLAQKPSAAPPTGAHRMFFDAAVLQSYDDFVVASATVTSGVGLRAGVSISRRFSANVEWETARDSGRNYELEGPEHFFFGGHEYMSLHQSLGHSTTYSVLLGIHSGTWKRMSVALLGGPTFIDSHRIQSGNLADRVSQGVYVVRGPWEDRFHRQAVAPTLALEMSLRITDHFFVLPEARGHLVNFPIDSLGRRGVALRWRP